MRSAANPLGLIDAILFADLHFEALRVIRDGVGASRRFGSMSSWAIDSRADLEIGTVRLGCGSADLIHHG